MVKLNLPLWFALSLPFFFACPAWSMSCGETTIRNYVQCQEECVQLSPEYFTKIDTLVATCSAKVRFGCQLSRCGEMGFACRQNPDHPFEVCANGVTRFTQVDVNDRLPAAFRVDVNAPPLKIQYYFLVDTSGSMAPHLDMAKQKIRGLLDMYKTTENGNAEFALGSYRDPQYSGSPKSLKNGICGLNRIRGFTSDINSFSNDVNRLAAASDTRTGPKGLLPAIIQIAKHTSDWDAAARKILVIIGDAPGYEETFHDVVDVAYPLGRKSTARILTNYNISLIAVNTGRPGLDGRTINYGPRMRRRTKGRQISFLAERTGGVVTSPSRTLMDAVIAAKERHVREYTLDTSDCDEHGVLVTVNGENSAFRVLLRPRESSTVDMSLIVGRDACFNPFQCKLLFREDGIDLAPMTVEVLRLRGCPPPPLDS